MILKKFFLASLAIVCLTGAAHSQGENSVFFYKVVNKHSAGFLSKELNEQFKFFYKLQLRHDTIFPSFCLDSLGRECFPKVPYKLYVENGKITARYFEELLEEKQPRDTVGINERITLFSLDSMSTVKLDEPIDFPIMFFDYNIETKYVSDEVVTFGEERFDCYKFKLLDFPEKGYTCVYIDKRRLIPVKYEVFSFSSGKKDAAVRDYSSINLFRVE